MAPHTFWYSKKDPSERVDAEHPSAPQDFHSKYQAPTQERPSMSSQPFRFVNYKDDALYPRHESANHINQPAMIDLLSGDLYRRVGSIRQPVADEFLQPQHPLSVPSVEEHDSDQELSIIEPDFYSYDALATDHATASTKPLNIVKADATLKHSKHMLDIPSSSSNASQGSTMPNRRSNGPSVPVIATDTFSSVLGGLHRLPTAPTNKPSKLGRIKRFFSLRRHRQYGRASR